MNTYEKVIAHYGHEAQKKKAIEELQELIIELSKDLEFDGELDKQAMLSEIADVINMCVQLAMIYDAEDEVEALMQHKMNRTLERIEKERNGA